MTQKNHICPDGPHDCPHMPGWAYGVFFLIVFGSVFAALFA